MNVPRELSAKRNATPHGFEGVGNRTFGGARPAGVALGGVILEVDLEDRLQAVAQVLTALETDGTGRALQVDVMTDTVRIPGSNTFVDMPEQRHVRCRNRHATDQRRADHHG